MARSTYRLPYFWSRMSVGAPGPSGGAGRLVYRSRRRWPGPGGARCDAEVVVGAPFEAGELGPLDHFLTARYRLWTVIGGRLAAAGAEHPPWSLRRARLVGLDQDLLEAAGLPRCQGAPVVHASDGVRVRIGAWHRATGASRPR